MTRYCLDCGIRTTGSRCPAHAKTHRLGWAWSAIRAAHLAENPRCVVCGDRATDVDHRVPREFGGTHDAGNLQSLCHPCHVAKTAADRGGRVGRVKTCPPPPIMHARPRLGSSTHHPGFSPAEAAARVTGADGKSDPTWPEPPAEAAYSDLAA